jgi:glycosyltransferase involved in cell wall biosynthesis
MMREKISACILCCNEEQKIERCLRSLTWCEEIVVLDSFSTDRTVEICRRFTDQVHQHTWLGYVGQRNLIRQMARHSWLLFVDADEEVSPGLRDEIVREFERGNGRYVGYEFPRLVFYLGRWIRHGEWYPDVKLRLYHRDFGRTEGIEPHDKVVVTGPVKRLRHPLWHYTYDDVRDHLETLNRFSSIMGRELFVEGRRFGMSDLLLRPTFRFLRGYVLKRGFMDGLHGFAVAAISSFGVFVKYLKLWELTRQRDGSMRRFPDEPQEK